MQHIAKQEKLKLGLIILLALVLRLFLLNKFPYGFHFDEAKAAWNTVSIMTTGRDDHGNFLPSYYDSFGDYRPTGIFYLIIPFILIFGKTVLAVRLPAAILGALTIIPIYLIANEISPKKSKINFGLWAGFFLAVNPWHINTSRATSEVVISLFFTAFGLYFLIKTIKSKALKNIILSIFFLLVSFCFYHSIRVLAPLLTAATIGYYFLAYKKSFSYKRSLLVLLVVSAVSLIVLLSPKARGRLGQVSIRSDFKIFYETQKAPTEEGHNKVLLARTFHNKYTILMRRFTEEYFSYFGSDFLVGRSAKPIRYITTNFGLITYIEFFLLFLGIAATVTKKDIRLAWIWLLLAPIPAAATMEDVPNLHRSMLMVIPMVLIEAWGMSVLLELKSKNIVKTIMILWTLNFVYYLHFYYNHGNFAMSVYSRNGGMVELAEFIGKNKDKYDKIVLTNYSDNTYPWIAYFDDFQPEKFNKNFKKDENGNYVFENLIFGNQRCPANLVKEYKDQKNVLFVDGEGCEAKENQDLKLKEIIYRLDDSPPFKIWEKK